MEGKELPERGERALPPCHFPRLSFKVMYGEPKVMGRYGQWSQSLGEYGCVPEVVSGLLPEALSGSLPIVLWWPTPDSSNNICPAMLEVVEISKQFCGGGRHHGYFVININEISLVGPGR